MQTPDRIPHGRPSSFAVVTTARFVRVWLLPVCVLGLALGAGAARHVTDAQDGGPGRRISATFSLQVDTSDPKLNNLCIGESALVPVQIMLQAVELEGSGSVDGWTVNSAEISAEVGDPSIVSAVQSGALAGDSTPGAPQRAHVTLTGKERGRTSITITATLRGSITVSRDGGASTQVSGSSQAGPISVPVQVVPCQFRVDVHSMWITSMHRTSSTILIANLHNARLIDRTDALFRFEPPQFGPPFLQWTWANNRIPGCYASSGRFDTPAPTIEAERFEDHIDVTITYARAVPGDSNSPYYRTLCLPHHSTETCGERPDGRCWKMPANRPYDWFHPQRLEPPTLRFRLEGETISTTHRIEHSWGSASGTVHITLTPVPIQ
jgi:hypothetical protein